tara:strand:+ start:342 stop:650 length:309 start_codon:yes stop_codon:yes gene_type:complete
MIYAVLNHLSGRGKDRHFQAFKCHTPVQSEVENFMLSIGFGCTDYSLMHENDFTEGKDIAGAECPHLLYCSNGEKDYWVMETDVKVSRTQKGYRFTVIHECE